MPVEPGIVDTNVLVYALDADAPQHAAARALLEAARETSTTLYVTSQILCEFYSIVTNPRRVSKLRSTRLNPQQLTPIRRVARRQKLPAQLPWPLPASGGGETHSIAAEAQVEVEAIERAHQRHAVSLSGWSKRPACTAAAGCRSSSMTPAFL